MKFQPIVDLWIALSIVLFSFEHPTGAIIALIVAIIGIINIISED